MHDVLTLKVRVVSQDIFDAVADSDDGPPVTFEFSPNRGQQKVEIAKFASGGELSRVMLALSLAIGASTGTQMFDEIDQGVGGKTALSIGSSSATLATQRQVIVVTHLAQVAVFA